MGLWLKCPGCQAQNPLLLKVCPHCGHDLDKLSCGTAGLCDGAGRGAPRRKPGQIQAAGGCRQPINRAVP